MRTSRSRFRAAATRNLVAFEVGGVAYAVEIEHVREIMRPMPVVALPHTPSAVIGVIDHRGDVVPVVDLRERFAVEKAARDKDVRWIVVTRGGRLFGLVVDRVIEVFGPDEASSREPPPIASGQLERGITSACFHEGRLLFVLDVHRLTSVVDGADLPTTAQALRRSGDEGP